MEVAFVSSGKWSSAETRNRGQEHRFSWHCSLPTSLRQEFRDVMARQHKDTLEGWFCLFASMPPLPLSLFSLLLPLFSLSPSILRDWTQRFRDHRFNKIWTKLSWHSQSSRSDWHGNIITFYNKGLDRCNEKIDDDVTNTEGFTGVHDSGNV